MPRRNRRKKSSPAAESSFQGLAAENPLSQLAVAMAALAGTLQRSGQGASVEPKIGGVPKKKEKGTASRNQKDCREKCACSGTVRTLIAMGADPGSFDGQGLTPLDVSIMNTTRNAMKILVEFQAVMERNSTRQAYLHRAIMNHKLNSVRTLLECGVPPDLEDMSNITPIQLAVERDNVEAAALLAEFGAEIHPREGAVYLLHVAAKNDSVASIKWFLEKGLDVDGADTDGRTPLHHAAIWGNVRAAKILVESHSNVNQKDNLGYTPLRLTQKKGGKAVSAYLRSVGATR